MIPVLTTVNLNELGRYQINKICDCPRKCQKGIAVTIYDDGFIICWNQARKTMYELIKQLDDSVETAWTEDEIKFVISHYKEYGTYYGVNRVLGDQLGKSTLQVKNKVRALRKAGRM